MVTPFRRRACAAALALFCAGFLSTCDFLTADIFPSWFSYVEARVDLLSILKAEGLGDQADVVTVEYAPYVDGATDHSAVLVFAAGNLAKRLVVLDAGTLARRAALFHANLNASVAATAGDFRCGDARISPSTLAFLIDPTAWANPGIRMFRNTVAGSNFVVRPNSSSQAMFEQYDPAWNSGPSVLRNFDLPNNFYNFLDAEYVNGWSALASLQNYSYGFAASYLTAYDFCDPLAGITTVFDTAAINVMKTGPFPVSDNQAWLTSGGPVALLRGDRSTDRLVRYRWGTGGFTTWLDWSTAVEAETLDSIPFDNTDELRILSFDASGTWWFVYDRRTGYLYKLRTWWK